MPPHNRTFDLQNASTDSGGLTPNRFGLFGAASALEQFPHGQNPILAYLSARQQYELYEQERLRKEEKERREHKDEEERTAYERQLSAARFADNPEIAAALGLDPALVDRLKAQREVEKAEKERSSAGVLRALLGEDVDLAQLSPDDQIRIAQIMREERESEDEREERRHYFNYEFKARRQAAQEDFERQQRALDRRAARDIVAERNKPDASTEAPKQAVYSAIKAEADLLFLRQFGRDPEDGMTGEEQAAYLRLLDATASKRGVDLSAALGGGGGEEPPPQSRDQLVSRLRAAGAPPQVIENARRELAAGRSVEDVWALFIAGPGG
jgi:hypothetical protein